MSLALGALVSSPCLPPSLWRGSAYCGPIRAGCPGPAAQSSRDAAPGGTPQRWCINWTHRRERSETSYCTCRCESCRRNSPFGAVVISGSPLGDRRAGSPDVKAFAQFIVVCSASILAEKLRMSSPLSSQSCENKGGSLRPTRAYICQVKPSTNPDNLSVPSYGRRMTIATRPSL